MKPCSHCKVSPKRPGSGQRYCEECAELRLPPAEQEARAFYALAEAKERGEWRARVPKEEWPEGRRWCSGCARWRRFDRDGVKLDVRPDASRCRVCTRVAGRSTYLKLTYGIDEDEYDAILAAQGGVCAVCGPEYPQEKRRRMAVDHDHVTGEVRGVLCGRHNHDLLGAAFDDPRVLLRAASYLIEPTTVHPGASLLNEVCGLFMLYAPENDPVRARLQAAIDRLSVSDP